MSGSGRTVSAMKIAQPLWVQDACIRLVGALLLASVWLAMRALLHSNRLVQHHDAGALDYLLALWAVVGGSSGTALLLLGRHIFDQVEVSARWARYPGRLDQPTVPDHAEDPWHARGH